MEPLILPDKNTNVIGVNFKVEEVVLHGASNVSKVESLNVIYKDKKVYIAAANSIRDRKKKSFWRKIVGAFTDFKDLILREIVNALQGTIQKTVQKKLNSTDIENGLVLLLERLNCTNLIILSLFDLIMQRSAHNFYFYICYSSKSLIHLEPTIENEGTILIDKSYLGRGSKIMVLLLSFLQS
ncbi:hypothetical protein Anas_05573 [Armadillidium nasatum]|uniref:Uncharacterized protein n=1 Tax=Armadillidium nasatum TaxID=96803 RepID=A0A5N5T218_9CRUS|nr:hypothetical protein Anas_05573 [Armadillidium nasatum]